MSNSFDREQINRAANDGADLVSKALSLGDRDKDLVGLAINAMMARLDTPDIDFDTMAGICYDDDPRTWWDFGN